MSLERADTEGHPPCISPTEPLEPRDCNSVLSRLKTGEGPAYEGWRRLSQVTSHPVDGFALGLVVTGAFGAVDAAVDFLGSVQDGARRCRDALQKLSDLVRIELDSTGTSEVIMPRGRSLRGLAAWAMCMALGHPEASDAARVLGGLVILEADHYRRRAPGALADLVRREAVASSLSLRDLRSLLAADHDVEDTDHPWLEGFRRRWPRQCNVLSSSDSSPLPERSFDDIAQGQVFGRAHYAGPAHKAGVPTHRQLGEAEYRLACKQVAAWLADDDWRGTCAVLCAISGLTSDLILEIPIAEHAEATGKMHVDVAKGCLVADLSLLAKSAASPADVRNVVPASHVLTKPLPERLVRNLRSRLRLNPGACALGGLYPDAKAVQGHVSLLPGRTGEITPSWSRWTKSTGAHLRLARMDNTLASVVSGDFGNVPRSKLHYAAVSVGEIWEAMGSFYKLAGWGPPSGRLDTVVAFGARVVPTADALTNVAQLLRARVEVLRPSRRRRSVDGLVEFHDAYVSLIAFELSVMLALRAAETYDLWANVDEEADLWVEVMDKRVPGPVGALPVPLAGRARQSIRAYRIHCSAIADRLAGLGAGRCDLSRALASVGRMETVQLLCRSVDRLGVKAVGSSDVFGNLPASLRLVPDPGRKWLENSLRLQGLRTGDIDAVLRHDVAGQSRCESGSDFLLVEWIDRVCPAIDRAVANILGPVPTGLTKRYEP